jgi:hypothetical protein
MGIFDKQTVLASSLQAADASRVTSKITNSSLGTAALGAVSNLRGFSLPDTGNPITQFSSLPTAASMRNIAVAAEFAAQQAIDTALFETYKDVFNAIKSIASSGQYEYDLSLNSQQIAELSPLLTKNGYKVISIINSQIYTTRISWRSNATTTTINFASQGAV